MRTTAFNSVQRQAFCQKLYGRQWKAKCSKELKEMRFSEVPARKVFWPVYI